jgi:urease accessory protein
MTIIKNKLAPQSARPVAEQVQLVVERAMFLKRRWRIDAPDGTEFGFDLESRLNHGCIIHQTDTHDYVVLQQPELIYEIETPTPEFAALVGWKVGNLHFPIQVLPDRIRILHDSAITQLFEREKWTVVEATAIFNPMRVVPHAS